MIEVGYLLIFIGLILVFAGLVLPPKPIQYREKYENLYEEYYRKPENMELYYGDYRQPEKKRTKVKGGGIIMIGPIPIIFGDAKTAFYLAVLAIILMIFGFMFMIQF